MHKKNAWKKNSKKKFLKQIQEEKKIQKNYNTLFFGLGPKGPTVTVEGCSPPKSTNVNKQTKQKTVTDSAKPTGNKFAIEAKTNPLWRS